MISTITLSAGVRALLTNEKSHLVLTHRITNETASPLKIDVVNSANETVETYSVAAGGTGIYEFRDQVTLYGTSAAAGKVQVNVDESAVAVLPTPGAIDGMVPIAQGQTWHSHSNIGATTASAGLNLRIPVAVENEVGLWFSNTISTQAASGETLAAGILTIVGAGIELIDSPGTNLSPRQFFPASASSVTVAPGGTVMLKVTLPVGWCDTARWVRVVYGISNASGNIPGSGYSSASYGEWFSTASATLANGTNFDDTAAADSAASLAPWKPVLMGKPKVACRSIFIAGDSTSHDPQYYVSPSGRNKDHWSGFAFGDEPIIFGRYGVNGSNLEQEDPLSDGSFMLMSRRLLIAKGHNEAIIQYGLNTITGAVSGETAFAKVLQFRDKLASLGVKRIAICTLPPVSPTSTDNWLTTGNQTDGNATYQARRVAFNALARSLPRGEYIDFSDAVSNGGGDGTKWKAPSAALLTLASTATGATTTRIPADYGAAVAFNRYVGHTIKITARPSGAILLNQTRRVDLTRLVSTTFYYNNVTAAFKDDSNADITPAAGTTFEIWAPYTPDGVHYGPGAVADMKAAITNAGWL